MIDDLSQVDIALLKADIASRQYTAKELAKQYDATVAELRAFVEEHREEIETLSHVQDDRLDDDPNTLEPTPEQLDSMWITKKAERLWRLQVVAERLLPIAHMDNMAAREFRSYLAAAANELGQLLHRGAGDVGEGATLSIDIGGVDLDNLR